MDEFYGLVVKMYAVVLAMAVAGIAIIVLVCWLVSALLRQYGKRQEKSQPHARAAA